VLGAQAFSYNANDEIGGDTFDANGNTLTSGGHSFAYDFENRLISKDGGAVTITYDCDGNRVAKTVGGVTTRYLVDDLNPTGYLQVLEEVAGGAVQTRYTYGTNIVSQTRTVATTPSTGYYGYDGHGNITFLTDAAGAVTNAYDYDAWGILVASNETTPNTRLYSGEELDPDLGLVNLRARQYKPNAGRFMTFDPLDAGDVGYGTLALAEINGSFDFGGDPYGRSIIQLSWSSQDPSARLLRPVEMHRFAYANGDPVDVLDPSGLAGASEEGSLMTWMQASIRAIRLAAMRAASRPDCIGLALVQITACLKWRDNPFNYGVCIRNTNIRYLTCLAGLRGKYN